MAQDSNTHCNGAVNGHSKILNTLKQRPVIGDGGFTFMLEKRGYVQAGCWTPECVLEHPDAVRQLHNEFLRAGADVVQTYSFYSTDNKLKSTSVSKNYTSAELNKCASEIARDAAASTGAFLCGGISPTPAFDSGHGNMDEVRQEFRKQTDVFAKYPTDFLLGEYFAYTEEAEIAVEVMKEAHVPVAISMRMGPSGDHGDVTPGECALRLARAGADIIGINCSFDPSTCLKTLQMMKDALTAEGLSPFLMVQPVCYHVPDAEHLKDGYHVLPEWPFALEPRILTRFECRKFAREAYNLGVRYIGGCCGFEPYHIRAMAEELAPEIGHRPPGKDKNIPWAGGLAQSSWPTHRARANRAHWENMAPSTGRPKSCAFSDGEQYDRVRQISTSE